MRRFLLALAAALVLLPAQSAPATIWLPPEPHDPELGCEAIKRVVAGLNQGRLADPQSWSVTPRFFHDSFGKVEAEEEADFLHAMRHAHGKPDLGPIELRGISLLHKDREDPIYLVRLDRESWHLMTVGDNGTGPELVDDPGYGTESSYWLASFLSNGLIEFRQVPEMYRAYDEDPKLKCSGA